MKAFFAALIVSACIGRVAADGYAPVLDLAIGDQEGDARPSWATADAPEKENRRLADQGSGCGSGSGSGSGDDCDGTTEIPTSVPTSVPTQVPTQVPSQVPTQVPSQVPSQVPTQAPSQIPTQVPSKVPTGVPSSAPSDAPELSNLVATTIVQTTLSNSEYQETLDDPEGASTAMTKEANNHNDDKHKYKFTGAKDVTDKRRLTEVARRVLEDGTVEVDWMFTFVALASFIESQGGEKAAVQAMYDSVKYQLANGLFEDVFADIGLSSAVINVAASLVYLELSEENHVLLRESSSSGGDDGLTDAELAGIIVGSVVGFFLIVGIVFFVIKQKSSKGGVAPDY